MKLGMINSAWEQAGTGVGLVGGLHKTKELGFDCVDIFQDPLDDNVDDRIATIKQTCDELQLPIISVVGVSVGDTTLGTTVANLGFDESAFPAPVFIGDTLRFETEVVAARASGSRPDAGIVTFEHRAHNQRDELVCRTRRNALMRRRP